MSVHLLQINLDIQHTAALSALGSVNSAVDNIVNNLQQVEQWVKTLVSSFTTLGNVTQNVSAPQIMDPNVIRLLSEADALINKIGDAKSATDYSDFIRDAERLNEINLDLGANYKNIAGVAERISMIEGKRVNALSMSNSFLNEIAKTRTGIAEQIEDILKDEKKITFENKTQFKEFKKYFKMLEDADKLGKNAADLGLNTNKTLSEIVRQGSEIVDNTKEQYSWYTKIDSILMKIQIGLAKAGRVLPGVEKFAELFSVTKLLGGAFGELNKSYEKNHTVDKLRMSAMQKGLDIDRAFYQSTLDIASATSILTSEAQASVNALAGAGGLVGYSEKTADSFNKVAASMANTSLATGVSNDELADLAVKLKGANVTFAQTSELMDDVVELQYEFGYSNKTSANMVTFLNKNMALMSKRFENSYLGTKRLTTSMGMLAGAARSLGLDADEALSVFQKAFEDPLSSVLLLGDAINSSNPSEQMFEMSKNAADLSKQLEGASPIVRKALLDAYGLTEGQLSSLTKTYDDNFAAHADMIDSFTDSAEKAKYLDSVTAQFTETQNADKLAAEARENASRKLEEAWDSMKVTLYELIMPLADIAKWVAGLLSTPLGKWLGVAVAGFVALYSAIKMTTGLIGGIGKMMGMFGQIGTMMKGVGGAGAATGSAGGLGKMGTGLKELTDSLGKIKIGSAVKAAAGIAIISAGLAAGVWMLGKAAATLPPDKALELVTTVGSIAIVTFILSKMSSTTAQALPAAVMLAAVGAALAAGVALLGLALSVVPPDKMIELGIMVAALLAATVVLALIAPVAPVALVGAVILIAVGAALAASIALLGLALHALPDNSQEMADGLLSVVGTMALLGPAAALGAAGAALLMSAAVILLPAAAILSLVAAFDIWETFPQKLAGFVDTLGAITEDKVQGLQSLAIGILDFTKSMGEVVAGGFFGLFGGDLSDKAAALAESIALLTGIGGLATAGKGMADLGMGVKTFAEGMNLIEKSGGSIVKLRNMVSEISKMKSDDNNVEVLNKSMHTIIDPTKSKNDVNKQQESLEKITGLLEEIRDTAKDRTSIERIAQLLDVYLPEISDSGGISSASNQYTT